jgi:hypothetical protein
MDLNVNFWGLRHNFETDLFQGLKLQKSGISYGYRFIFLKKTLELIWPIQTEIYDPDLNKMKGPFRFNLDHPFKIQRLGTVPSIQPVRTEEAAG